MIYARILALPLLGAGALLACSTSSVRTGTGGSSGSSSSSGGGAAATGTGGATGSGGTLATGGAGGGLTIDVDASTGDAAGACAHLNIGIFGNPGADASSNFQQWLVAAGTSVQRIQTTTTEPVTAATLQPLAR